MSNLQEHTFIDVQASHSPYITYVFEYYNRGSLSGSLPCSEFHKLVQHITWLADHNSTCCVSIYHRDTRLGHGYYTRARKDDKQLLLPLSDLPEEGVTRGLCDAINAKYAEMEVA